MEDETQNLDSTELNPTNAFGELLLDLIEAQYGEGNIDDGIAALVEATSLPEDQVVGIISGDVIVQDSSVLEAIAAAFPDANDEDIAQLVEVATGVDQADRDAIESQYEGGAEDAGEDPAAEGMAAQAAAYAAANNPKVQAQFNHRILKQLEAVTRENKQLKANFSNDKAYANFSARLSSIDSLLTSHVRNEVLPPSVKKVLIGDFTNPSARLAQFSAIAKQNGARDLQEQLFATEFAISLLENVANVVEFRDYSATDEDIAVANFSANLDKQVEADLVAIGYQF